MSLSSSALIPDLLNGSDALHQIGERDLLPPFPDTGTGNLGGRWNLGRLIPGYHESGIGARLVRIIVLNWYEN
jgi:hypothetical protein